MVLTNTKLLIILSAALCCLILTPLYAENHYIFPDEVINRAQQKPFYYGQAKDKQYQAEYSAQQRYWTYPQYVSDFDKKNQPTQYSRSNSTKNNIRYPETYKKYGVNEKTSNTKSREA